MLRLTHLSHQFPPGAGIDHKLPVDILGMDEDALMQLSREGCFQP